MIRFDGILSVDKEATFDVKDNSLHGDRPYIRVESDYDSLHFYCSRQQLENLHSKLTTFLSKEVKNDK